MCGIHAQNLGVGAVELRPMIGMSIDDKHLDQLYLLRSASRGTLLQFR
jgi:hypothetical protein